MAKNEEVKDGPAKAPEEAAGPSLVKMVLHAPAFPGGPTEADVHPDEVANYALGGWTIVSDSAKKAK